MIKDNYAKFEVDYYGVDNDNYVDGAGFCCEPKTQAKNARSLPTENVDYEKLQYYYHSDHLGSASYITNLDGEVVQHIEYVPFGEVFLEERNNTWNTPFLFNGKELDEETGLYYYGARYYNPRISLWYGVDPLAENYPGVSAYAYCVNNPVMLIDPDGMKWKNPKERNDLSSNVVKKMGEIIIESIKLLTQSTAQLTDEQKEELTHKREDLDERYKKLERALLDIDRLEEDPENTYVLDGSKTGGKYGVRQEEEGGLVYIETPSDGISLHEISHVRQSLDAGGLKFQEGYLLNASKYRVGISDNEVEGYQIQYAYDETFPGKRERPGIKGIDLHSVGSIKHKGKYVYKVIRKFSKARKKEQRKMTRKYNIQY